MPPSSCRTSARSCAPSRSSGQGWCVLSYPASGCTLRLAWPAEQVPYLAVLPNEGGWQDLYSIFLEPATASFDRLDVARLRGECSTVEAGGTYDWHLDVQML